MDDFVEATALDRKGEHTWGIRLREDWALWGPAGGYLAALALRAAGEATAFSRPVSLSCQYLRVARFDPVEIHVASLRSGKRSEALRVDLVQDEKLILTASAWATVSGNDGMQHDYAPAVSVPARESLRPYEELYPDRKKHPFLARMEQLPIDPAAEGDRTPREPELRGLFRFRPRAAADDAFVDSARVMLLLDTHAWLSTYPAHPADGPSPWIAPNLDFYYRFHRPTMGHEWLYMMTRADLAEDGLIAAHGEIRDLRGCLLARGASQLLCGRRPEQFR